MQQPDDRQSWQSGVAGTIVLPPLSRHMTESQDASKQRSSSAASISFDADGRVLSASPEAAAALGYGSSADLIGVFLSSLIGDEAAITVLDRVIAAEEQGIHSQDSEFAESGIVKFVRQDGTRIPLDTFVTPENSGGWLTLLDPAGGTTGPGDAGQPISQIDVAATLRTLVETTRTAASAEEVCQGFAHQLRASIGADELVIARSGSVNGMYEAISHFTPEGSLPNSGSVDLPPSLIPANGAGPVQADSLDTLALFDPAVIGGTEITGAFLATRAELADGAHLLIIATAPPSHQWPESTSLLVETGALSLASAVHAAELRIHLATQSRTRETVRQVGLLASQDNDGNFLDAALKVIARRLPISAISIHASDSVTGRCYVAATAGQSEEEYGDLAPAFEWDLPGSLEQRVLNSGRPAFLSASSREMTSIPPATISRWRSQGLQAVAAIPLREAGEPVGVLIAGLTSDSLRQIDLFRLMESIAPAVHLGIGLTGGGPGAVPPIDESTPDSGFVSPKVLLALTRAASESHDSETLFASVTEWLLEIVPSARVAWGTIDRHNRTYRRVCDYAPGSDSSTTEGLVVIAEEEFGTLDLSGLNLGEPGSEIGQLNSMRAAVVVDQRVLAVVTVWPREGEPFEANDLARLDRVNEFIAAPLARILETEAILGRQRERDMVSKLGAQAAQFHEPAPAFRSMRTELESLFPHDRVIFVELDTFTEIAVALYDSDASPVDPVRTSFPISVLPSAEIVESTEPLVVSFDPNQARDLFSDFNSLLSVPVSATDGPAGFLLLLGQDAEAFTPAQTGLATLLSDQLTGAQAGWHAYRSTREAARDLREVRKQLNLILESAPVAIISTDPNGVCTWLDGHGLETLGVEREEMLGRSIFELTGKMPELEDAIRQALRGVPATAVTPIGSHSAEVWAQPVTALDGSVNGVTLIGYDVSAQVRSRRVLAENRELQSTLKQRSRIVSTVSHELRNQLTSIIAYTDVLSFGADDQLSERQAHALSVIQRTAGKLDTMISDLLGLDYELDLNEVNVGNFMREIIDAQEPIFSSARQTLSLSLPDVECTVKADHLRLSQVVTNLLSNASKYSPAQAIISVEVNVSGDQLEICVADNGPGIPPDQVEHVWETGTRLANTHSRTVPGSGLGLSIARKIVELHGGKTELESELGVGTRVTVTLPGVAVDTRMVVKQSQKPAAAKAAKLKPVAGSRTRRQRRSAS